jgi:hypothetical protein
MQTLTRPEVGSSNGQEAKRAQQTDRLSVMPRPVLRQRAQRPEQGIKKMAGRLPFQSRLGARKHFSKPLVCLGLVRIATIARRVTPARIRSLVSVTAFAMMMEAKCSDILSCPGGAASQPVASRLKPQILVASTPQPAGEQGRDGRVPIRPGAPGEGDSADATEALMRQWV